MNEIVITYSYIEKYRTAKYLGVYAAFCLLSGCFGGTIAQHIARSITTSIADNAIASAMDVNEDAKPVPHQNIKLQDRQPSELSIALMNTGFRTATATNSNQQVISQPTEKSIHILQASSLARVKLFNLIIGDEKNALYENARRIGALNLPDQQEWESWLVATGMIESSEQYITFLIPPKFGKLPSGSLAIVEIAKTGDLNIARYTLSERKVYQAMDQSSHSSLQ